ncbi:MAG: hypothetical protein N2645_06430 [Clostridia bacterium]|nr:hypothetical protein [Clostridia bacterium]
MNLKRFIKPIISIAVVTCLTATAFAYTVSDSLINSKWIAKGGAAGFLGNPTTNTLTTPNGLGVYNHFQGGSIYRKKTFTEAFTVYGLNRAKWAQLGWENGFLGFPTTDETSTYNQTGRFNHFEGGSIYYKNGATQSYEVHGSIRSLWSWMGWETSQLGFPKTDEYIFDNNSNKRASRFDNGAIYWEYHPAIPKSGMFPGMPAYVDMNPVMTVAKYSQGTPFGTQRITSVSNTIGGPVEFPSISFTVSGSGFPANKKVTVRLSSVSGGDKIGEVVANSSGSFTLTGSITRRSMPAINNVSTIWAQSESGPAAIYSYVSSIVKTNESLK